MSEYFIIYRDLEDWTGPEFEGMPPPEASSYVIKEQTIPGMFGMKDVIVRHYHRHIKRDIVNLITYTHQELKQNQIRDLANRALKWVKEN